MAFKEALQNVVKHSGASSLRLSISLEADTVQITLEDNGKGFAEGVTQPEADGLRGMRDRLRQLGGRCDIVSSPGQGTRVTLRLPLLPP